MTKEEFNNLKIMLASADVADINLAGRLLVQKLGLTNRAKRDGVSVVQLCSLLQVYYNNKDVGFSPVMNECDYTHLFKGDLVQSYNDQQ